MAEGVLVGASEGAVDVYRGVPYAQAPVGPLRWRGPQPPLAWEGEKSALHFGPIAAEHAEGHPEAGRPQNEDCLTLNIWAPQGATRAPVMVWIHGGGFQTGSGSRTEFDGYRFATDGVVLVTLNYRLGVFGFFAHPALTKQTDASEPLVNYGIADQLQALRWVRANIAAFGGDPGNVTVFGCSAGGGSVLQLMAIPAARGLFAKAIVESASGWIPHVPIDVAEKAGIAVATQAGLPGAEATADQLRALPTEALLKASGKEVPLAVDGRLVTESLTEAFQNGHAAPLPMIIGTCDYEASVMLPRIKEADVLAHMAPQIRALYTGSESEVVAAFLTDAVMGAPARWFARKNSERAPTFLYTFTYIGSFRRDGMPGARHGDEVEYVFGNLDVTRPKAASVEDRTVQRDLHQRWVAFAKAGNPRTDGAEWPAYTAANDTRMELGAKPRTISGYKRPEYDAFEAGELKPLLSDR